MHLFGKLLQFLQDICYLYVTIKMFLMFMYVLIAFASFDLVVMSDEFKGSLFEGFENMFSSDNFSSKELSTSGI